MSVSIKNFPTPLVRIGGEPFDILKKLTFTDAEKLLGNYTRLQSEVANIGLQLSTLLYTEINNLEDKSLQNKLLNLKRDVHNARPVADKQGELLQSIDNKALVLFNHYQKTYKLTEQAKQKFEQYYTQSLDAKKKVLKGLALNTTLQKGLILSSQDLQHSTLSYSREPNQYNKKEGQIENSLIKYLSRICAKTSPFSTFNNIATADIAQQNSTLTSADGKARKVKSHIAINNFLYAYIKNILLKHSDLKPLFSIRINPTVRLEEDVFYFLTNFNNVEAFQKLDSSPLIELIYNILGKQKNTIQVQKLCKKLIGYIDAEMEQLYGFIYQLIDYGFIEYDLGASGIDPFWDYSLCKKLRPLAGSHPLIAELIDALKILRKHGIAYEKADTATRKAIIAKAYEGIKSICYSIHEAAGLPADERLGRDEYFNKLKAEEKVAETAENKEEKPNNDPTEEGVFKENVSTLFYFKPEQLFYEDTTTNVKLHLHSEAYQPIINTLNELADALFLYEGHRDDRLRLQHFYNKQYADSSENISLLKFYEDYYRLYKKPEKEWDEAQKKRLKEANNPKLKYKQFQVLPEMTALVADRKAWKKEYQKSIKPLLKHKHEIALPVSFLNNANKAVLGIEKEQAMVSYGAFLQFYQQDTGELKAVLNGLFSGYGKMFSRFLHILQPHIRDTLRQYNVDLHPNELLAENADSSYFNANIHPPLMPYEIKTPGGHNTLPFENQVPVTDIIVKLNDDGKTLGLYSKLHNKRLQVFDLCFQSLMGRSELYQLLEKFSHNRYFQYYIGINSINEKINIEQAKSAIKAYPRIWMNKDVVLQRQWWRVDKKEMPVRTPQMPDWEYFLQLNIWRKKLGIPADVFVTIASRNEMETDAKDARKLGRDDYKPQYIDFNNPFFINLLEKILAKTPQSIKIEEMLPAPNQLFTLNGKRFVTEAVVQWHTENT